MRAALTVFVAGALALAACSGGDDGRADPEGSSTTASTLAGEGEITTSEPPAGDGSTFCDAMIAVGQVRPKGDTPAEVLTANSALADQLDEAEASLPEDSPADLAALLDDYRAAVSAINAASGNIDKAYASLPKDVVDRLGSATSHKDGYGYLVRRCGITAAAP